MNDRLRSVISMAVFVVLAGYVGFSALRLGLLLWQRFGAPRDSVGELCADLPTVSLASLALKISLGWTNLPSMDLPST